VRKSKKANRRPAKIPTPLDFFIRNEEEDEPSFNIGAMLGTRTVDGDVGIEVEVEGNKFPKEDAPQIPKVWRYTHDGSLRGHDNAEYVLRAPIKFDQVDKAVDDLWKMFTDYGSVLDDSNRTSVHVHLNAQGWHLDRLTAFLALYFSVEELLTQWCGDHRVGNLFCLRSKDATSIVSQIRDFIRSDGELVPSQGMHYAGLNCHALTKYGSVEIRSLRGATEADTIKTWVSVLRRLYDLSGDYPDPRAVVEGFSGAGPLDYLNSILLDIFKKLLVISYRRAFKTRRCVDFQYVRTVLVFVPDHVNSSEVNVQCSESVFSSLQHTCRWVDTFTSVHKTVGVVTYLPVRIRVFEPALLLLHTNHLEVVAPATYVDTVLVLLLYVLGVERSSNKVTTYVSNNNTSATVSLKRLPANHRKGVVRYVVSVGPVLRREPCVPQLVEEQQFVCCLFKFYSVVVDGRTARFGAVTPVDNEVVTTGNEAAAL